MEVVFSKEAAAVRWDGGTVRLAKGQPWDANDPFVLAYPRLFSTDPALIARTVPYVAPVEQATANPGEKRNVRVRG
jgi:hypothetical protein